jgi:hypothetical protein
MIIYFRHVDGYGTDTENTNREATAMDATAIMLLLASTCVGFGAAFIPAIVNTNRR